MRPSGPGAASRAMRALLGRGRMAEAGSDLGATTPRRAPTDLPAAVTMQHRPTGRHQPAEAGVTSTGPTLRPRTAADLAARLHGRRRPLTGVRAPSAAGPSAVGRVRSVERRAPSAADHVRSVVGPSVAVLVPSAAALILSAGAGRTRSVAADRTAVAAAITDSRKQDGRITGSRLNMRLPFGVRYHNHASSSGSLESNVRDGEGNS